MQAKHNYYKFSIRTSDGFYLSNVIEYQGLLFGKMQIPDYRAKQKRTEPFALIRYSHDEAQPETLWQGEITNFDPGYNLEIFPHPMSPGDFLVFSHPISNMAASHCYWLQKEGTSTEILAAQTVLVGLKYIHYYAGKFIGVFHKNTKQRIHIGNPHRISIGEINMSFHGKQGQLIQIGKQIGINIINTAIPHDLDIYMALFHNRICSVISPDKDYLVFQLNLSVQVKYNILTHELTATTDVIEFRQPDGTFLDEWEAYDIPPNPLFNCLYAVPITGTPDFLVEATWVNTKLYIYKQSDKRFHMIATPQSLPVSSSVHFLTPKIAIITKNNSHTGEYWQSLASLDCENLTFTIIGESHFKHSQSISVMPSGTILLNDCLCEPIQTTTRHPTHADKAITSVATAISNTAATTPIPYQICKQIAKFTVLKSSMCQTAATLSD